MKDLTTMFDHPAKFLCDWDHGNITEIHTMDSLYRHYLTSNLFDSDFVVSDMNKSPFSLRHLDASLR